MRSLAKKVAAMSALAMLGPTGAQASILAGNIAGGSEVILSFVNASGDSISQDLGEQVAAINAGDTYNLDASVLSFISAAGGAANVTYGIVAGTTTTRNYLTSSGNATFVDDVTVANGVKSNWLGSINNLVTNLNQGDVTPTSTNLAYGPFAAGSGTSNYLDGGYNNWSSGDFALDNLTAGNSTLYLYKVVFSSANLGLAAITSLNGLFASLDLSASQLQIGSVSVVPVPAAVWLLGSALGLLSVVRRRVATAA
ncbi:MAG: hypothetical protein EXR82_06775 [Gammaproteobacteria bacterium]|nr:hypothetical protein [Gammaproteobacteria bacterium]